VKKFSLVVWVLFGMSVGCGPAPAPEILTGEGIVEKVVIPDRRVVVAHEDIPGFMHAMTMSFEVNKPSLLHKLKPGDHIRFTLERTKLTLHLVAVEKIALRAAEGEEGSE
jgi:protein SCO1/2